jgi:hypothetical protein
MACVAYVACAGMWVVLVVVAVSLVASADAQRQSASRSKKKGAGRDDLPNPSTCVASRGEARNWGLGYKHVVVIRNGCEYAVVCSVGTDVQPERYTVRVEKGATEEVVTLLNSPALTFRPSVDCTMVP